MAAAKKSAKKTAKKTAAKKTVAKKTAPKAKVSATKAKRNMDEVVFEARDLRIHAIRDDGSELPIVKGVDFKVRRGEVVALIGESGSGKTTISLSALGYCKPCLLYTSPSPRDLSTSRMPSSA